MKKALKQTWKTGLIVVPFVFGMIGFYLAGTPFLQSIYHCICLYGMGHQNLPANGFIEAARWLAPVATASSLVLIIKTLRRYVHALIARLTGKSVAVYGDGEEQEIILRQLGARGIPMKDSFVRAHSYILMGNEEDNMTTYSKYSNKLADRDVYLMCSSLPSQASSNPKLHLFSPEETAARFFWKDNCPYELSVKKNHKLSIVIIGFEKLGKELLLSALQNNVFDPDQQIEYHIIGKENGFTTVYSQLSEISDRINFYDMPWTECISVVEQADMIILSQQEDQLSTLRDINFALPHKLIYVLTAHKAGTELLSKHASVVTYDWKEETLKLEHIIEDKLNRYAKRINLRYAHLYSNVELTDENLEKEWADLDAFTRNSNISAADYHDIRLSMIKGESIDDVKLEHLSILEHIRWCRYHYLNNWRYGKPANGKHKDRENRIHTLLVPYEELSEPDKEKDRENIRMLLTMDKEDL